MNIKTVLISGAFGFIGTNFSKYLKDRKSYKLIALDIDKPKNHQYDLFYNWNQLQEIDWDNIDIIIHLAGKAHDTKKAEEEIYRRINVVLTQEIYSYFKKSKTQKFIYFSSVKAVADSIDEESLTEETLPNPQTLYGKSKLQAEQYILEQSLPLGKKIYILRPCMIHGPSNKGNLNLLYKLAQKGLPWPLGAFVNSRSFTSIQNLLFVIQELIEKDIEPGTYQIADDESLSTNELIRLMADSLNKKTHIWNISPSMIKVMAKIGDILGLPLNSERLKKLTESYVVSNQKIKKAIGIEKMPYTATEGMKKTFTSFL